MRIHPSRFSGISARVISTCVLVSAMGSGAVYADLMPITSVDVQVVAGATGGIFQDQQNHDQHGWDILGVGEQEHR